MGYNKTDAQYFLSEHFLPEYNIDLFVKGIATPQDYTNPLHKKNRRPLSANLTFNTSVVEATHLGSAANLNNLY